MTQPPVPIYRPTWANDLCDSYPVFLFYAGQWTLILAILLGTALAATGVVAALRNPAAAVPGQEGRAPEILDTIKDFVQAIAGAPTWLALFAGGILLLWMAINTVPEQCDREKRPAPEASNPPAQPQSSNSAADRIDGATNDSAG
jgi:hypothetical protein